METPVTVYRTTLYIAVSCRTAGEMAGQYHFSAAQRKRLAELLSAENRSLWDAVLAGTTDTDTTANATNGAQLVSVALSQIGNQGGAPYWRWYSFDSRVEWCACFVSWCADQCGYLDSGIIPKFSGCLDGVSWFQSNGQWKDRSYKPQAGDIIFFDWEGDGKIDHAGVVVKYENNIVYTIEGNSGDACRQNQYTVGNSPIYGYGIPAY